MSSPTGVQPGTCVSDRIPLYFYSIRETHSGYRLEITIEAQDDSNTAALPSIDNCSGMVSHRTKFHALSEFCHGCLSVCIPQLRIRSDGAFIELNPEKVDTLLHRKR